MKRSIHLALAAFALGAAAAASAIPIRAETVDRSLMVVPDEEKRSRIVEVIATVPIPAEMQPTPSPEQISDLRESAIQSAKQMALNRVRDELGGKPAPAGFTISPPEGLDAVYVIELRDLPADNADELKILMKAELRYRLERDAGAAETAPAVPDAATGTSDPTVPGSVTGSPGASPDPDAAALMDQEAPLTVRVWTERKTYQEGEPIVILVTGNRDFYGRIDYEDMTGDIIQVLPNEFRSDTLFKAGTEYRVPGEGDKFRLVVKQPFGTERIRVFASLAPLGSVPTQPAADGLALVRSSREDVARRTRSIMIEPTDPQTTGGTDGAASPATGGEAASTSGQGGVDFYEATWEITTEPQ